MKSEEAALGQQLAASSQGPTPARSASEGESNESPRSRFGLLSGTPPVASPAGAKSDLEAPEDLELAAVLEAYLAAVEQGRMPDRARLIAEHPAIADRLRGCLETLDWVELGSVGIEPETVEPDRPRPTPQLGDFRLLRQIGRGGMGVVYEAEQISLGRRVALKVLPFAAVLDPKQLRRFKTEAQAAAQLHHTNIVPVYAVGCERGVHYYVMQYIDGQPLSEIIAQLRRLSGVATDGEESCDDRAFQLAGHLTSGRFAPAKRKQTDLAPAGPSATPLVSPGHEIEAGPAPSPSPETPLTPALPAGDRGPDATRLRGAERGADAMSPPGGERGAEAKGRHAGAKTPPLATLSSEGSTHSPAYFRTAANLGIQAAEALEHAHNQGIIHRDIKPSNLLLDIDGRLWITDFGLARIEASTALTMTGDIVGTMRYMSPEQALAKRVVIDHRTDVYSLGATLYELLTFRPVFSGRDRQELIRQIAFEDPRPPRRLVRSVPSELETIVLKAMAKNPVERYEIAQDLAEDLRRFLDDKPIKAKRPTLMKRTAKWARRHQAVVATAGAFAIVCWLMGMAFIWREKVRSDKALAEIQQAEQATKQELWRTNFEKARATRFSAQVGQRFEALKAVQKAAQLGRELGMNDGQLLALRREAIAALLLPDLKVIDSWTLDQEIRLSAEHPVKFDPALQHYVWAEGNDLVVRRVADHREQVRLAGPTHVWTVERFSPNGRFLLASYRLADGVFWYVWDLATQQAWKLPVARDWMTGYFSPDTRLMAASFPDGSLRVYESVGGQLVTSFPLGYQAPTIAFHPQGGKVAVAGAPSGEVEVRDLTSGQILLKFGPHALPTNSTAWHPDGSLLAAASDDGRIYMWDVQTGQQRWVSERIGGRGIVVWFHPSGEVLLSSGWDGLTRFWDVASGRSLLSVYAQGHHFDPNDATRLGFSKLDEAGVWEWAAGKELRILQAQLEPAESSGTNSYGTSINHDGRLLVSFGHDGGRVWLWDLATGKEIATLPLRGSYQCAMFRPDGSLITSSERGLYVWPIRPDAEDSGRIRAGPPRRLLGMQRGFQAASLSRDGRLLAVIHGQASADHAHVLDLVEGVEKAQLRTHANLRTISMSPDGRWVATGTWKGHGVKIWDAATGACVRELLSGREHAAAVFSPDGKWLVTNDPRHEYCFWTVDSRPPDQWQPRHRFANDVYGGLGVYFTRDGKLATLRSARESWLVDPHSGRQLAALELGTETCFTPDGGQLAMPRGPGSIGFVDLARVRRQLADLGLDWGHPPLPPLAPAAQKPLQTEVHLGELASPDPGPSAGNDFAQCDLEYYSRVIELSHKLSQPYYERARLYTDRGQYKEAVDDYRQFLDRNPDHAAALNNLAWLFVTGPAEIRDPEQARALAERAVELAPDKWEYLNTLGVSHFRLKHYDQAVEWFKKGIDANGGKPTAFDWYFLAMTQQALGDADQALECYDWAVRWQSDHQQIPESWAKELAAFRSEAEQALGDLLAGRPPRQWVEAETLSPVEPVADPAAVLQTMTLPSFRGFWSGNAQLFVLLGYCLFCAMWVGLTAAMFAVGWRFWGAWILLPLLSALFGAGLFVALGFALLSRWEPPRAGSHGGGEILALGILAWLAVLAVTGAALGGIAGTLLAVLLARRRGRAD